MLKVSQLYNMHVYAPKGGRRGKKAAEKAAAGEVEYGKIGRIHMTVFTPDGSRAVGFMVKRPDIAGMVKREDLFLGFDSFKLVDKGKNVRVTRGEESFDDAARGRLDVAWDRCVMWEGMDAKTSDGKELGYVNDAEFDGTTGAVSKFFVGDGGVAQKLVGSVEIPASMLRGYDKGWMIVDPAAAKLELNGGAAARAGEATARAKVDAQRAGKKIGKDAAVAVDKGSRGLGKMIGDTRRAFQEASGEPAKSAAAKKPATRPAPSMPAKPAADVTVEKPAAPAAIDGSVAKPAPTTYEPVSQAAGQKPAEKPAAKPASKKPATSAAKPAAKTTAKPASKPAPKKKPASSGEQAARAVGKQLGAFGSMFGAFADEYKKASK